MGTEKNVCHIHNASAVLILANITLWEVAITSSPTPPLWESHHNVWVTGWLEHVFISQSLPKQLTQANSTTLVSRSLKGPRIYVMQPFTSRSVLPQIDTGRILVTKMPFPVSNELFTTSFLWKVSGNKSFLSQDSAFFQRLEEGIPWLPYISTAKQNWEERNMAAPLYPTAS